MSDVAHKLQTIFTDLMAEERVPLERRTRVNCPSWDSLAQLNLILAIEQEFKVTISDEEVIDLNSYGSVLHLIEEKLAAKDGA